MKNILKFLSLFVMICCLAITMACNGGVGVGDQSSSNSEQMYSITLSECSIGGSVLFNKEEIKRGESVTITIVSDVNFKIAKLLVNDFDVTNEIVDGQYTVTSVKKDIDVKVLFKKVNFQEQEENNLRR